MEGPSPCHCRECSRGTLIRNVFWPTQHKAAQISPAACRFTCVKNFCAHGVVPYRIVDLQAHEPTEQQAVVERRTLPWLASEWGCRDRRLSRAQGNPDMRFLLWHRPLSSRRRVLDQDEPIPLFRRPPLCRGGREFSETRPRQLRPLSLQDRLHREYTRDKYKHLERSPFRIAPPRAAPQRFARGSCELVRSVLSPWGGLPFVPECLAGSVCRGSSGATQHSLHPLRPRTLRPATPRHRGPP